MLEQDVIDIYRKRGYNLSEIIRGGLRERLAKLSEDDAELRSFLRVLLVKTFGEWFSKFVKKAGPFSVNDWGIYPDFVYETFFKENLHFEKAWESLVKIKGRVEAIEWLHNSAECPIEKSDLILY